MGYKMEGKKCIDCAQYKNCKDTHTSWVFVVIGMIATISIRVVTVLMHINPIYGKIAWYIGVGGFLVFFVYRFKVSQGRAKLINQKGLMDKITNQKQLAKDDYDNIEELLCGLVSKKERVNYFFIFIVSALALLFAVYLDFFNS